MTSNGMTGSDSTEEIRKEAERIRESAMGSKEKGEKNLGYALSYNGTNWTAPSDIDGSSSLNSVSCTSSTFCMAVDDNGYDLIYNGSTWTKASSAFATYGAANDVSCVSSALCVAVGPSAYTYVYKSGTWTSKQLSPLDPSDLLAVSCTSTTFCMAVSIDGLAARYNPSNFSSWNTYGGVLPWGGYSISCKTTTDCEAVGFNGYAAHWSGSWGTATDVESGIHTLDGVSCGTSTSCVAVDSDGNVFNFNGSSWSAADNIDGTADIGSVSCPNSVFCEAVDANGAALNFNSHTTTENFAWDQVSGGGVPRLLTDGTNAYIYGPTLFGDSAPVEQISLTNNTVTYLSSIPSGVQLAFTASGSLIEEAQYSTYGARTTTNDTTPISPFGFQGGYTDQTGLIYLNARYYDPNTAQFLSVDPLSDATGEPYSYADDDPLNGSDPSGLYFSGGGNSGECSSVNSQGGVYCSGVEAQPVPQPNKPAPAPNQTVEVDQNRHPTKAASSVCPSDYAFDGQSCYSTAPLGSPAAILNPPPPPHLPTQESVLSAIARGFKDVKCVAGEFNPWPFSSNTAGGELIREGAVAVGGGAGLIIAGAETGPLEGVIVPTAGVEIGAGIYLIHLGVEQISQHCS